MYFPITARQFWSSLAAWLCLSASGCRPAPATQAQSVFVYCTFSGEAQARILKRALEEHGGWEVVLAPLTGQDLLAAIEGTRAGDVAVFPEPSLQTELAARGLLRGEALRYDCGFYAVTKTAIPLADLGQPGRRLGSFRQENALSQNLVKALPEEVREAIAGNIRHRSDRADELVRLVRLGALDAAFTSAPPPAAADLQVVPVGGPAACCPLLILPLACSRLTAAQTSAVMTVWRGADVVGALQQRPSGRKAGEP